MSPWTDRSERVTGLSPETGHVPWASPKVGSADPASATRPPHKPHRVTRKGCRRDPR